MRRVPPEERKDTSDFDDAPALQPGPHNVIITEVSKIMQNKNGAPYRFVRFDENGSVHSEYFGMALEWKWEALVKACGFDLKTLPDEYDETKLEGSRLQIDLERNGDRINIKKYGMKRTEEVRPWLGSGTGKPLVHNVIEQSQKYATPIPEPSEQDEPENDDEMPF